MRKQSKRIEQHAWKLVICAVGILPVILVMGWARSVDPVPEINGIINGNFETGDVLDESGWTWHSWDGSGSAAFDTSEARSGRRSVKIARAGKPVSSGTDWALINEGRLDVNPGEVWTVTAWVKFEDTDRIELDIVEVTGDEEPRPLHFRRGAGGGTHEAYGTGDWRFLQATSIVPPDGRSLYVRINGVGAVRAWVDDVQLRKGPAERTAPPRPKVEGWAFNQDRVREVLGRGLVAMPREEGDVYLRWRLLEEDKNSAFHVYRSANGGEPVRLNDNPVMQTTDFIDDTADLSVENRYFIEALSGKYHSELSEAYTLQAHPEVKPYHAITLDNENTTFQKVGIGDLNGDGHFDYVIKTPNTNIDPFYRYWRPSETTYKLEAYLSDGTFLWRKDLGWNIEAGIWYSPYVVFDFTGNGRAEVAVKTAPTHADYRDGEPSPERPSHSNYKAGGRVRSGPEYISILDGMTGEELARADWPSRDGLGKYSYTSRNQIGVAYLDGKTPCVVAQRGTYSLMKLSAFQFNDGELEQLWAWESSDEPGGFYHGQGAHNLHTLDLDGDGRDEILLGAAVIDDNGDGLWAKSMGHPDNLYVGNLDPGRPGMEVYLGMETTSNRHGISMLDARTGELIWGLDRATRHIHGSGLVSNIDASNVGMETYSGESNTDERWLYTAQGKLIAREDNIPWSTLSPRAVYWDGTTQREMLVDGRIFRFPDDETLFEGVEGRQVAWLDLFGDWREEIITSVPGELRIYRTPIPAKDRRVTLVQDHLYRTSVAHMAMGYGNNSPLTSYFIE